MVTRIRPGNTTLTIKDLQAAYPVLYLNCDTSAPCNIYLPVISGNNTFFGVEIFIVDGNPFTAGANPITVFTQLPNLINGQTQVTINTNNGSARIRVVSPNDYLFLSSQGNAGTSITTLEDVDGTFALPLLYTPSEDEVVNILTQLKAVSDSGQIYSIAMTRTILGVASDPPGAIVPVGNAKLLTDPPQTKNAPGFSVDFTETDNTGFIQFISVSGEGNIVVTIKESCV